MRAVHDHLDNIVRPALRNYFASEKALDQANEANDIARIKDAKRHLKAQGVFSGGKRPFGLDIVQDGDVKRLVPNASEQAAIARMRALRQGDATYREIGAAVGKGWKTVQRILDRER